MLAPKRGSARVPHTRDSARVPPLGTPLAETAAAAVLPRAPPPPAPSPCPSVLSAAPSSPPPPPPGRRARFRGAGGEMSVFILATGGYEPLVRVFDAQNGQHLYNLHFADPTVSCLAFSHGSAPVDVADPLYLAVGGSPQVAVYDAAVPAPPPGHVAERGGVPAVAAPLFLFAGHAAPVTAVGLDPAGPRPRFGWSAAEDGWLMVWDPALPEGEGVGGAVGVVSGGGAPVAVKEVLVSWRTSDKAAINAAGYCVERGVFVAADAKGRISIWGFASRALLAVVRPHAVYDDEEMFAWRAEREARRELERTKAAAGSVGGVAEVAVDAVATDVDADVYADVHVAAAEANAGVAATVAHAKPAAADIAAAGERATVEEAVAEVEAGAEKEKDCDVDRYNPAEMPTENHNPAQRQKEARVPSPARRPRTMTALSMDASPAYQPTRQVPMKTRSIDRRGVHLQTLELFGAGRETLLVSADSRGILYMYKLDAMVENDRAPPYAQWNGVADNAPPRRGLRKYVTRTRVSSDGGIMCCTLSTGALRKYWMRDVHRFAAGKIDELPVAAELRHHIGFAWDAAFVGDTNDYVFSSGSDMQVILWDLNNNTPNNYTTGHTRAVVCLAIKERFPGP